MTEEELKEQEKRVRNSVVIQFESPGSANFGIQIGPDVSVLQILNVATYLETMAKADLLEARARTRIAVPEPNMKNLQVVKH